MRTEDSPNPAPGEVWRVDLKPVKGSETDKTRPAMVVSIALFENLTVRLVVPLTAWDDKHLQYPWRVPLEATSTNGLTKKSAADCGQIRVVSLQRFSAHLGRLSASEFLEVKAGLAIAMDINTNELTG